MRERVRSQLDALPPAVLRLEADEHSAHYPVTVSERLQRMRDRLTAAHEPGAPTSDH